jgi:hypothetical protein
MRRRHSAPLFLIHVFSGAKCCPCLLETVGIRVPTRNIRKFIMFCCPFSHFPSARRVSVGRAIAQAVSRRLPTAAARFRSQVRSRGICAGQIGTGAGFLRVVQFPLSILIPPNAPYSSIIRSWYNRSISGRRTKWTQSHPTAQNQKTRCASAANVVCKCTDIFRNSRSNINKFN